MTKVNKVYCNTNPLVPADLVRDKQAQWIETKVETELYKFLSEVNTLVYEAGSMGWQAVGAKLPDLGANKSVFVERLTAELLTLGYTLETYEGNTVRISW